MKQSKKQLPAVRVVKVSGDNSPEGRERLQEGYRMIYRAANRWRREQPDEYAKVINSDEENAAQHRADELRRVQRVKRS